MKSFMIYDFIGKSTINSIIKRLKGKIGGYHNDEK